jgi:uncharacterized Fe-S cluster-containing radical SAM superfamily protein
VTTSIRTTRPFHLPSKPVGPLCNLDCAYCFYLEKAWLYPNRTGLSDWAMSNDVLEAFVRSYIAEQSGPVVSFAWQGGEPTLLGLEYFKKIVTLQDRYADGWPIENTLQTNGVLLDDAWCAFLREHDFLVGISVPSSINGFGTTLAASPSSCSRSHWSLGLGCHRVCVSSARRVAMLWPSSTTVTSTRATRDGLGARERWGTVVTPRRSITASTARCTPPQPIICTRSSSPGDLSSPQRRSGANGAPVLCLRLLSALRPGCPAARF